MLDEPAGRPLPWAATRSSTVVRRFSFRLGITAAAMAMTTPIPIALMAPSATSRGTWRPDDTGWYCVGATASSFFGFGVASALARTVVKARSVYVAPPAVSVTVRTPRRRPTRAAGP